jgi:hypothetical protein
MTVLARRDLLAALLAAVAGVGAGAGLPALAQAAPPASRASPFDHLDRAAATRIGQAWLANHPRTTAAVLAARLFPSGRGPDALPALRRRVAEDFRRGAVFDHRGWRLSDTEGALFGLLALEAG